MQEQLEAACGRYRVTGGVLGIMQGNDVQIFATGMANTRAGIEATPDTLFQIGSITKVWTATLVMMLVEEGVLDLDAPVVTYLPEFKVADPDVTARVTLRDLLSHRSGIGGDHFVDTGRGDDNLERYVASCAVIGQEHELGATMSYCNTGYSIVGRVIEKVTGRTWDAVLKKRLVRPLGLTHTNTLPEEALLFRAAAGHVLGDVAPMWVLPRSAGPAGLINARAADVLAFARFHLDDGRAPDGTQLLSAASVKAMQEPHIEVPDRYTLGDRWGLGWILFDWDGHACYGHDGTTLGQRAYLRVAPEADLAVCLLTNGGEAGPAFRALVTDVFRDRANIAVPPMPTPPAVAPDLDLSRYEGTFSRLNVEMTFVVADGGLTCNIEQSGGLAMTVKPSPLKLVPVDRSVFLATSAEVTVPVPLVFFEFDGDTPKRVHFGARALKRRGSAGG